MDWDSLLEIGVVKLGLLPETFWGLTWKEFVLLQNAYNERCSERMVQAWYTAAYTRTKKMPSLRRLLQSMKGVGDQELEDLKKFRDKNKDKWKEINGKKDS